MQLSNRNRECIIQFFWHFFVTQYEILKFLLRLSIEKSSNNFYYCVVTFSTIVSYATSDAARK